jgi:hypothetical protein
MRLFKQGRKPYLEYIRNIPSQALLIAMGMFAARGLDINSCCITDTVPQTALFFILTMMGLSAWGVSSMQFMEEYLAPEPGRQAIMYKYLRGPKHSLWKLWKFTWSENKGLFAEAIFVTVVLQVSLVVVISQAVFIATGFLQAMNG